MAVFGLTRTRLSRDVGSWIPCHVGLWIFLFWGGGDTLVLNLIPAAAYYSSGVFLATSV